MFTGEHQADDVTAQVLVGTSVESAYGRYWVGYCDEVFGLAFDRCGQRPGRVVFSEEYEHLAVRSL